MALLAGYPPAGCLPTVCLAAGCLPCTLPFVATHVPNRVPHLPPAGVQVLGKALGIEQNAVRTFAEAEIRAG